MGIGSPQNETGYLRGIKLIVVTPLEASGAIPSTPVAYKITTPQEITVDTESEDGDRSILRGGDQVLVSVKDYNVITGVSLKIIDAKYDIEAHYHLCGGTLIEETIETIEFNVGWEMPTIVEQQTRTPVMIEVYVSNFNTKGSMSGYCKYTFWKCIGYAPSLSHKDKEWGTPELNIDCEENASLSEPIYHKQFVSALPA